MHLRSDGTLTAWGWGPYGVCDVSSESNFVKVATGYSDTLALRSDGSLAGWGYWDPNVPSGYDFVDIAVGTWYHCLALKSDGSIVAWGRNDEGQCDVPEAGSFVAIAAGSLFSLAIRSDGSIVGWGQNSLSVIDVPDGHGFVAITAGQLHGVALTSDEIITLTVKTDPNIVDTVRPHVGENSYYRDQRVYINATVFPNCPDVYYFDHWQGDVPDPESASGYLIMDADKTITAVFVAGERVCGDLCHPILQGDLNEDCYINFEDFSVYIASWLACTHPDCD